MNEELAVVESGIRRSFLTEIGKRVDREIGPVVHLISAWKIDKARDIAWVNAAEPPDPSSLALVPLSR